MAHNQTLTVICFVGGINMKLTAENKVTIQIIEKLIIFLAFSGLTYIGNNIANSLDKVQVSVSDLNTKFAVQLHENKTFKDLLIDHESRLRILENKTK